jgi:hypothetical protein
MIRDQTGLPWMVFTYKMDQNSYTLGKGLSATYALGKELKKAKLCFR